MIHTTQKPDKLSRSEASEAAGHIAGLRAELNQVFVNQDDAKKAFITGLITGNHVLAEGQPGTGKTTLVQALGAATGLSMKRFQGTPDMTASEFVGARVYDSESGSFIHEPSPLLSGDLILADEINRVSPKALAALLEYLAEGQVTAGDETRLAPDPHMVIATRNGADHVGTFPMPEAALDRFGYAAKFEDPSVDVLAKILTTPEKPESRVEMVSSPEQILALRGMIKKVEIHEDLVHRIARVVDATNRPDQYSSSLKSVIDEGVGVRAARAIMEGAQAQALADGRNFVTPSDINSTVITASLLHRLQVKRGQDTAEVITDLINATQKS